MTPPTSLAYTLIDRLAFAVNPILVVWLIIFLILATRRREIGARAWLAAIFGIVLVYVLQNLDNRMEWWKRIGGDYSTHSALAAAVVIPLCFLRPRLWPVPVGILALYLALMMLLGFHTFLDIGTTLFVVAPPIIVLHFVLKNRKGIKTT